jgi:hypothetical protein
MTWAVQVETPELPALPNSNSLIDNWVPDCQMTWAVSAYTLEPPAPPQQ